MLKLMMLLYVGMLVCIGKEGAGKGEKLKGDGKIGKMSLVSDKSVDRMDTEGLLHRINDVVKEYESFRSNVLDK